MSMDPDIYERNETADGSIHLVGDGVVLTVMPDGETRAFSRVAMRVGTAGSVEEKTRWLVGELDGVRVYVQDGHVILTKRDLYP